MMFDSSRHIPNDLNTPKNLHNCPHNQFGRQNQDIEEPSPIQTRLKLKRLPQQQPKEYVLNQQQQQSHTFTSKAQSTMIQGFSDQKAAAAAQTSIIEILPLPKKNRKGTEQSSTSQNNTQSLRLNGGDTKNTGYATNKGAQNEKEEEIKLPIIKIETNIPQLAVNQEHGNYPPSGTYSNRQYEQFSLANYTPLYQNIMGGQAQLLGINNLGDTPYSISKQTPQQFLFQQLQNHQVQQQLALSLNAQQLPQTQLLPPQTSTQYYYPFSPTGLFNYQNMGANTGFHLAHNLSNAYSPKGPTSFQAAVQNVTGGNNPSASGGGFFMNTPQGGIGPGDQSARNHIRGIQSSAGATNNNIGIQLINASSSGVAGSACQVNFLEDSAQGINKKTAAGGIMINHMAGATSSFSQQNANQMQFLMPKNQNLEQQKNQTGEGEQQSIHIPSINSLKKDFSFAQTVQNLASLGNRQNNTVEESPSGRGRGRSFGAQNLSPKEQPPDQQSQVTVQKSQMTFTKMAQANTNGGGGGSITNKASNKTASLLAANQKKIPAPNTASAPPDDDPQSFSNMAAKRWQGSSSSQQNNSVQGGLNNNSQNLSQENSPLVNQKSSTPKGMQHSLAELAQTFNTLGNAYIKSQQLALGSTANFSSENSAFKRSSPKMNQHAISSTGLQGMTNAAQLKGMPFSGNNTPRVFGSTNTSSDKLLGPGLLSFHNYKRIVGNNGSGLSINQAGGPPPNSGSSLQNGVGAPYFGNVTQGIQQQIINFTSAAQVATGGVQGNFMTMKTLMRESPKQGGYGAAAPSPSNIDHNINAGEFPSPIQITGSHNHGAYGLQVSTFSQKVQQQQINQQSRQNQH